MDGCGPHEGAFNESYGSLGFERRSPSVSGPEVEKVLLSAAHRIREASQPPLDPKHSKTLLKKVLSTVKHFSIDAG